MDSYLGKNNIFNNLTMLCLKEQKIEKITYEAVK